nr:nonstructural protein 1 NS1 [Chaphamaparvovirus anseriform 7]
MSRQVQCSRQSLRRLLWRGIRGESIGNQLGQETTQVLEPKDYVLRVMPVIDVERKFMNMRAYIGTVLMITDGNGDVITDPVVYGNMIHNMSCNDEWILIGERNKDNIFHVHGLIRCNVRIDSFKRTLMTTWRHIQTHSAFIDQYGCATLDMVKGQKAHAPVSLLEYMCKAPEWIVSSSERLLQLTYDIEKWDMSARFRKEPEPDAHVEKANPMVQEILQCILEHNCKTVEEVMKAGPEIIVKHLHKPGIQSIIQNCLTYSKCVGNQWSLKNYVEQHRAPRDPSILHGILLSQSIDPNDFDPIFWQWLTKKHSKKNTIHIYGPSNTGKSSFFAGLGRCCPGGEVVNGQRFNFEDLTDKYWGKWEEPLCAPEIAEKFKQIAEGMQCAIEIKFKRPHVLPRTPILITTNSMIWEWCPSQKGPFKNRMWFFTFSYDMTDGVFVPRCISSSCECRYCAFSRGGTPSAGCSTVSRVSPKQQSIQTELDSGSSELEPTMGSGPMSERAGSSRQSDSTGTTRRESSCDTTIRGSTSSTISGIDGSSRQHGSSDSSKRIYSSSTGSTGQLESNPSGGCVRRDPHGISGGGTSGRDAIRRDSRGDEILSPLVSMGGPRSKKPKMEISIQTEKQLMDQPLGPLRVPTKNDWICYLNYIYSRFEASGEIDLTAYEDIDSE